MSGENGKKTKEQTLKEAESIDFKPLWDFILLEAIVDGQTPGGLVIPQGVKLGGTKKGLVLKAGDGAYRDNGTLVPNPIKPGDYVYYIGMVTPMEVTIKGKLYLVMSGRDCVAIAREP